MSEKAAGAGFVYICNPNNPTGTLHGAKAIEEFVADTLRRDPHVTILIDEAYHEYVEREDYKTAIALAISNPRVIVSRTFSKIYGLAGMRIGYAIGQPDTIRRIDKFLDPLRLSCLSSTAALTAHADPLRVPDQRQRNHDARAYTVNALKDAGFPVVPSEANFIMFDTKRDIRQFQADCRAQGRRGRAAVPAAHDSRARHHRDDGRDEEGERGDASGVVGAAHVRESRIRSQRARS